MTKRPPTKTIPKKKAAAPASKATTSRRAPAPAKKPASKSEKTVEKPVAEKPVAKKPVAKPVPVRVLVKEPAAVKESAPVKAAKAVTPGVPVVAEVVKGPKSAFTLDGPIPPEGAGFSKKVGALLGIAQQTLGIKTFRPGQAEAFGHLLEAEDLLAVMPTGSGKSLLYQLTSLVVPGVTVVVRPLIALIKDQLDKMASKGLAAAKIDSTLTVKQRREVNAMIQAPGGKLLLTTPERMADPDFRVWLRDACGGAGVSRFVVDEAHCVSQWGHDFRPAYLSLRKAIADVGNPPVLATTATAPPHVRDDILFQLGIEKATIVTTTFDRPNLHYEVINSSDEGDKMKTLVTLLKKLPRPAIVYCATVKKVEELYEALTRHGLPVGKYHGRMNKKERDDSQNAFMASNDLVMVATNAFGLGVDKANIRIVFHYHVPGSLEAYAQEAGRGGRDGKPARCVLLFSPDDVAIQEYFLSGTYPTKRQVREVFKTLEVFTKAIGTPAEHDSSPTVANIALGASVGSQRTRTVLSLLKDEGFITEKEGGLYYVSDPPPEYELVMDRARSYEARRIADRQRLDSLLQYVKATDCRNRVILEYLGEPEPPKCGRCDNCLRSKDAVAAAAAVAARFGASLIRELDDEHVEFVKPKREIKARVVRIDQPAPTPVVAEGSGPTAAAPAITVLRRTKPGAESVVASPVPAAPTVLTRRKPGAEPPAMAAAPAKDDHKKPSVPKRKVGDANADEGDDLDDDDDDDDDLEDGEELEGDDDDLDDEDDDDLDDDDDDDDDYEVIDKTAAEIAEEGIEGSGEVTVLARKRVPKVVKQRPALTDADPASASAAEARRRRRRRRRKRRAMLPPKSAFSTPVLSTGGPGAESAPRRGGGGGPVIEYVRGPMRIAMAPVASANPNDTGVTNNRRGGRGGKKTRWDRPVRSGGGGGPRRFDNGGGANINGGGGPRPQSAGGPGAPISNGGAPNGPNGPGDGQRKRRRRRRKRGGGGGPPLLDANGQPIPQQPHNGDNGNGSNAGHGDSAGHGNGNGGNGDLGPPVSFFEPVSGQHQGASNQAPMLGPDGQPMRKRRRRRRRGRGGRNREHGPNGQPAGPPAEGASASGETGDDGDGGGDSYDDGAE